jgi:sulfopyruvate decarboxylase TPP-binding subunit
MYATDKVLDIFRDLGITHLVWLPDSELGTWEEALSRQSQVELVRVCREGEAWAVAAGLLIGGKRPVVAIQCTGLFESGDALRNVCFDLGLPIFAIVGYRSYLAQDKLPGDTARKFTEPILQAWGIPYRLINGPGQLPELADHYRECQQSNQPGVALLAEGRG